MPKSNDNNLANEYSIQIMRTFEEIERIRSFWQKVQWHPYSDIDYYIKFAKYHEGFIRPHVMLLRKQDQPKTIVIGWIQDKPTNFKIGYRTVFKPTARCFVIEYAGVIGDSSYSACKVLIKEIMAFLARNEADFAYFKFIRHGSDLFRVATRTPGFIFRDHFPFINSHWALLMPSSFEEFIKRLSARRRKKLRRMPKKLKKHFGNKFSVICYSTKKDTQKAISDVAAIAKRTYQNTLGFGFEATSQTYNEWLFAAEHDWLRVYVLYLNGTPAAFTYGYLYGKTYFGLAQGFDPNYKYYSP